MMRLAEYFDRIKVAAAIAAVAPMAPGPEGGHWRRLDAGEEGHAETGAPIVGKTWVKKKSNLNADVKPFAHQQDFTKAMLALPEGRGILAAHGTGTGKTLSAVGAFEALKESGRGHRALVITPSGLRNNFLEKGVQRFSGSKGVIYDRLPAKPPADDVDYAVISYEAFRRDPLAWQRMLSPDVVIADEIHRAGNEESETNKALWKIRPYQKAFIGLTASSSQNDVADIVPLVQLASGDREAPYASRRAFHRMHVKSIVNPGDRGVFGGKTKTKELVHREELYRRIGPYVHYAGDLDASQKPQEVSERIRIPMSEGQLYLYNIAMKGIDPKIRLKVERGEEVSKSEEANVFTALIRARQVSNSAHTVDGRMTPEQAAEQTPKIKRVLDDAMKHLETTPDGQIVMYSNVIHGGVDVLEAGLKARGIQYGVFSGRGNAGITEESRQGAVRDYLAGKNKVIVITGAGAEGLSLGNTTMVQLVDGHYNPERINQAKARGIRAGGLAHRKLEDRKVKVNQYVSTMPKSTWDKILFRSPKMSVDEFVDRTADRKSIMNAKLKSILERRSEHEEKKRDSFWYRHLSGGP